jgi:hypothetical protein
MIGLGALGLWAVAVLPAPAAWNNVFQPTLFHRQRPVTVTQYYVPPVAVAVQPTAVVAAASPCCDPCPQTCCYVQRCYYQPVTVMQTQTYYEPVTTYQTSYFYEPVVSYRCSYRVDPCTCCVQQVCTPCTSYALRAQCCPVQSWVQRCCQVPVTSYQKVCCWQPQTCCTPAPCATCAPAPAPAVVQPAPAVTPPVTPPVVSPPVVTPAPSITPPNVYEKREFGTSNPLLPPSPPVMPPASLKTPAAPVQPLKIEGIVMAPNSQLQGQVVHNDRTPQSNAKVKFVNTQNGQPYFTTSNTAGRFSVGLPSGSWDVFVYGADDIATPTTRLQITGSQVPPTNLARR